jgi:tetratricopeptide (TPR) repeat protein
MISPIALKSLLHTLLHFRRAAQNGLWLTFFLLSIANKTYADPILDKAQAFLKAGRADAATAIYTQYLKLHPTSLPAELALAQVAVRRFEYPKARGILENALAQHPESAVTAASLGKLFQLWSNSPAGKVSDNSRNYLALAQEHFRQAIMLGPENPLVLTYVAEWQLQQNDLISAERDLQKAIRIKPDFVPAFQGLTRFYIKVQDVRRAKDAIMHAIELDPADHMSYFLTAQLLAMTDHPAEAVKYAEKSEQLDFGRLPERDYFLATQYEKLGENQLATQYYKNLTVYTPRESQVWLKLADLYDSLGQHEKSLDAYKHAVALKPDIMSDLYRQARDNTRAERFETAIRQWKRLLSLHSNQKNTIEDALGAIAGLYYLQRFYHPEQIPPGINRDIALFEDRFEGSPNADSLSLNYLKMKFAMQGDFTETDRETLFRLTAAPEPSVAGEAAFLLEDFSKTNERLEEVDGLSTDEYISLADRLLLIQELVFSKVFYERAYQLEPSASLEAAMKRIQAKQALAGQRVAEGNTAFNAKDYQAAVVKYQEAARIYRQWDNVYLRLGDTYERLRRWKEAKKAYDTAISLTPGLMDSQGFAKNYHKLRKKVASK